MTDRIETATRILIRTCGRGRAYVAGTLALAVEGYTDAEQAEALRLWRLWKRGLNGLV